MTAPTKIAAARASARLVKALDDLVHSGQLPHCADPETHHLWLSDHVEERARAVKLCRGCPVFGPCGEAARARRESFGVWSGQDRTRPPGKTGRPSICDGAAMAAGSSRRSRSLRLRPARCESTN
jgi:hypothetical protein